MLAHKFKYSFVWSRWIIFNENLLVWRSHHCPRYTDYYDRISWRFNVQYKFLSNLKQSGLNKKNCTRPGIFIGFCDYRQISHTHARRKMSMRTVFMSRYTNVRLSLAIPKMLASSHIDHTGAHNHALTVHREQICVVLFPISDILSCRLMDAR